VITVVDPDAARRSLVAGELACPQPDCGGRLRVWSRALPRRVRGLDGTVVRATPDRARCRAGRVSHVLLPAGWLPRRGYDVEVVGAALLAAAEGAGYRRAATRVDVPASTVRDWIHAARDGAAGLISAVSGVIEAAGARLHRPQAPPVWAGRPLSEAVAALGVAARGFVMDLATHAHSARTDGSRGSTISGSWPNATASASTTSCGWSTPPGPLRACAAGR